MCMYMYVMNLSHKREVKILIFARLSNLQICYLKADLVSSWYTYQSTEEIIWSKVICIRKEKKKNSKICKSQHLVIFCKT